MERWFTSDLHFGHANIIPFCGRPWNSVEIMNEALISRWNSLVSPKDTVFILGDFAMSHRAETVPLAQRLNGCKCLVPGNHDYTWAGNLERVVRKWAPVYAAAGLVHFDIRAMSIKGVQKNVKVSHFPYRGTDLRDRTKTIPEGWYPEDDGESWLIHGHVHTQWQVNERQINVGVDVWDYLPVHESQIARIINGE